MKWISVKEKGLPKPNDSKDYFVYSSDGHLGYGHLGYGYKWNPVTRKYDDTESPYWYLDFDAHGEGEVTYYMEVEYPEDE